MNISMNNMSTYVNRSAAVNGYNQSSVQNLFSKNQNSTSSDVVKISSEGKAMSRMLRHEENREAHKAAFQDAYSELNIESLDLEGMTDEEKVEVLSAFESTMAEHMRDGYKPASEMNSNELDRTLGNIQNMGKEIETKDAYGMKGPRPPKPPGGKPPGGKPVEGVSGSNGSDIVSSLLEALEEDDEDSSDLIESLMDALSSTDQTVMSDYKSMEEILAQFNPTV